jgi:hypothetical protein
MWWRAPHSMRSETGSRRDASIPVESSPGMRDGRPSDDVESVHNAKAGNAAARIERRAHDLQVPVSGSPRAACRCCLQPRNSDRCRARAATARPLRALPCRRCAVRSSLSSALQDRLRGARLGSSASKSRNASTSPLAQARKKLATVLICRCSTSVFRIRQSEKPLSRATASSAVASFAW